jgi:hypothetical protein
MKHWDGRDRDDAIQLRLPQRDAQRIRDLFAQPRPTPPQRRRQPPHVGSLIGLGLALAMLAGMALLLAPAEPVSKLLN